MGDVILQLFVIFAPIVQQIVDEFRSQHNGETPTDEQMTQIFQANIDKYLAEGALWSAQNPKQAQPPAPDTSQG